VGFLKYSSSIVRFIRPTNHFKSYNFCIGNSTAAASTQGTFIDLDIINSDGKTHKSKRMKERKISDIVELVTLWRRLYHGIPDNNGNLLRYSLADAAKKVKVSKKSLDDYLLQLRFGKKYGFDFEAFKNEKVGVLRKFVKKNKTSVKDE